MEYGILILILIFINIDWFVIRFHIWPISKYGLIVKKLQLQKFDIIEFMKIINYAGYNREFDAFKGKENEYYFYEEIGLIITRFNVHYG